MTPTEKRRHARNKKRREIIDAMARELGISGSGAAPGDEFMRLWEAGQIRVSLIEDKGG